MKKENNNGLVYTADYTSNYTNRSLVEKIYVDLVMDNLGYENYLYEQKIERRKEKLKKIINGMF